MSSARRQAVVILGMHRSGTSAVAGTAVRLGLTAPLTPLPAADDNPDGFYESSPIVTINYHFLLAAQCAWNVCLRFDPDLIDEITLPFDREILSVALDKEFGGSPGFVVKDPRMCLTLPAWLPYFKVREIGVSAIIVVRHPREVVQSLARRNGFDEADSAPHWLHHMLEAERTTRGLPRTVVLYEDLLRDWRFCMRRAEQLAGVRWPRPVDGPNAEIDLFLKTSARHHAATDGEAAVGGPDLRDMVSAAWTLFRHLCDDPRAFHALASLDHLRSRFAVWRDTAHPPGTVAVFPAV